VRLTTTVIAGLCLIGGVCGASLVPALASATNAAPQSAASTTSNTLREVRHPVPVRRVAELQERLDRMGAHLKVTGIWGPATETALRHYERQEGLQTSGELAQATRGRLAPTG
jgi:peptidoglycan hydrolase-like protein with peptidoglycan-binding domain